MKNYFYKTSLCIILAVSSLFYAGSANVSAASKAEKSYHKLLSKGSYQYHGTTYSFTESGFGYTLKNIDKKGPVEMIAGNHDTYNAGMYSLLFAYKSGKAKCILKAYEITAL